MDDFKWVIILTVGQLLVWGFIIGVLLLLGIPVR